MKRLAIGIGLGAALLVTLSLCGAEKEDRWRLTVSRIFAGPEFDAQSFSARWLEDGTGYLVVEPSRDTPAGQDIVRYDAETGARRVVVSAADLVPPDRPVPLKIDGYAFSQDRSLVLIYTNSRRVWRRHTRGDYWVLDRASHELRKLGGGVPPSTLMFAKFSPDGRYVAYVHDNDLYLEDLRDGGIQALTTSGSDTVINGTFDWVYEEELKLRDGFVWSPDSRRIAYWQIDTRGVRRFVLVNNTDGLYPKLKWFAYPKAGQRNPRCRVGVLDIAARRTRWLEVPGDPRDNYLARMQWAGPRKVLLQQLNRLQNANRVMLADACSGQVKTLFVERDEAWVDVHDELFWLDDGRRFTWMSERDGWRHVYVGSLSDGHLRRITAGSYDVIRLLHVDEKEGWLYLIASPHDPTQRYLYRVRLEGGKPERLTPDDQSGTHGYRISPGARWAIHSWSSFGRPPRVELVKLPSHEVVRTLVDNERLRGKLEALRRGHTELFRVDIGEGVVLDAWCIQPPHMNAKKKYPLVVYVYGEPAAQTVLDRWGGKRFLWHLLLAQHGYVVMSFDNRGTPAPRGRAWRKVIYRQVGILAPADQAAAVRAVLAQRSYIDAQRIGVWGWSGGGSMTLNAIFKYPKLYKTAIAVA
ncbi:MAG TPA: S9 family peptidase, partial [Planctomycetaceae bacterium]|nr:S9 family peptidase [Planctomycetaceae bacterium]